MKAITIHQPWASLIAHGHKRFETRSWRTNYRGPIAIHAGKKIERQAVLMLARDHTRIWHKITPLPTGCIVAVAELADCAMIANWARTKSSGESVYDGTAIIHGKDGDIFLALDQMEHDFGDFSPGRYAWELQNVRRLANPISAKGKQGLWNWEAPELVRRLAEVR